MFSHKYSANSRPGCVYCAYIIVLNFLSNLIYTMKSHFIRRYNICQNLLYGFIIYVILHFLY
jgi:hypothetical protein